MSTFVANAMKVLKLSLIVMVLASTARPTFAQPLSDPFPFSLPILDAVNAEYLGTAVSEPAGDEGRITIQNGRFAYPDGAPARFLGTVAFNTACFPDSAQAVGVARQLSSLGFNAFRFMAYDYSFFDQASLLSAGSTSAEFDEDQMQRFDWFVYQLKMHGIYVHLPLHSRRTARPGDGVPGWDSIFNAGRQVNYFDPNAQSLYKQFTRNLLEHVNPYTGVAYKDEPALAFLDLTDEANLMGAWINGQLRFGQGGLLSYYHSRMLDTLFADYLRRTYGSESALRVAWSKPAESDANLIANPGYEDPFSQAWDIFVNEGARSVLEPTECGENVVEGQRALRLRIDRTPGGAGDIQLNNASAILERHRMYRLSFWAKTDAETSKRIFVNLRNAGPPFQNYGLNFQPFTLNEEWTEYTLRFRATDDDEFGALLTFFCGETTGDMFLDDVRLVMEAEEGLLPGESLAENTIFRMPFQQITGYSVQRVMDMTDFYTGLQKEFYEEMRDFIANDIGCDALINGSTVSHLVADMYSQSEMDFTARMEFWDFVRNAGDAANWYIGNDGMLSQQFGANIPTIARHKLQNKPLVISAFFMPFPSAHLNETMTMLPAYAAYQGWDAVYLGAIAGAREGYQSPVIREREYYEFKSNPALLSLAPSAAQAFKRGLISEARDVVSLQQTAEAVSYPLSSLGIFWLNNTSDPRVPLFRKMEIGSFDAAEQSLSPQNDIFALSSGDGVNTSRLLSDTDELLWNADDGYLLIDAPAYKAASGMLSGELLEFTDLVVQQRSGGNVGSFTWIADSSVSLGDAERALLTLSSRAENGGAVWAGDSSLGPAWGAGSVQMDGMELEFVLTSPFREMTIQPLNANGDPSGEPLAIEKSGERFRFVLDQSSDRAAWYVIVQSGRTTSAPLAQRSPAFDLELRATPNPAQEYVDVAFTAPQDDVRARLSLHTITGESTGIIWTEQVAQGSRRARLDISGIAAGTYFLTMHTGAYRDMIRLVILR